MRIRITRERVVDKEHVVLSQPSFSRRVLAISCLCFGLLLGACAKKSPLTVARRPGGPAAPPVVSPQPQPPIAPPTQPTSTAPNIQGSWSGGCQPYYDDTGYYYYENRLTVSQAQFTYSTEWYNDYCSEESRLPEYFFSDSGTYTVGQAEVSNVPGAHNLDVTFAQYGAWFSIVRLDGSTLYLGDDTGTQDGTSSELRPTSLRTSQPFAKASAQYAAR
jgi:hypothetical protein